MTNKEKAQEIALDAVNRGFSGTESFCSAMEMAEWKDEQFAKHGYTKEQLLNMGFGFTLNGDIITPKEETEMLEKYIYYVKQQIIEKVTEWLDRNFNMPNDFKEHFKKAMEEGK